MLDNLSFVLKLQLNLWNVVSCMTMWPDNLLQAEEHQIENEYLKEAIEKALTAHKFENSHESSWKAVNLIIQACHKLRDGGWMEAHQETCTCLGCLV